MEIGTAPAIRSIVFGNTKAWREEKSSKKMICEVQELIRWGQFLHGRITQEVVQRVLVKDIDQATIDRTL